MDEQRPRHARVGQCLGRVQTDSARVRPDRRGDPRGRHPQQGTRPGRQHPDGQPPHHAPAHLEVARAALVVGGVEDDAVAGQCQVSNAAQREGAEDAEALVVGQRRGVHRPHRRDRASTIVEEPPTQEGAVPDHLVVVQRHPGRGRPKGVLPVFPVQEGLVVRVVRLAEGSPQQRNDLRVVNRFSTPHHQIAGTDSSHIASRERHW